MKTQVKKIFTILEKNIIKIKRNINAQVLNIQNYLTPTRWKNDN